MKRRWKKFLAGVLSAALALNLAAPLALADSVKCTVAGVELSGDQNSVPNGSAIDGQVSYLNNTLTFISNEVTLSTLNKTGVALVTAADGNDGLRLVANGRVIGHTKGNGFEFPIEIAGGEYYYLTNFNWQYSSTGILGATNDKTKIASDTRITLDGFKTGIGGGDVQIDGKVTIKTTTYSGSPVECGIANSTTMNPGSELLIYAQRFIDKENGHLTYKGGHLLLNVTTVAGDFGLSELGIGENVGNIWYRTSKNDAFTKIDTNVQQGIDDFYAVKGQNPVYLELTDVDPDPQESYLAYWVVRPGDDPVATMQIPGPITSSEEEERLFEGWFLEDGTRLEDSPYYMGPGADHVGNLDRDVTFYGHWRTAESGEGSPDGGDGFGTLLAVGAVVGVAGVVAYQVGTELILDQLLPAGVAVPHTRAELAMLLWNTAGRPAPATLPAFADVADPELAQAAQWAIEQGYLKARADGNFKPDKGVAKWRVIRGYRAVTEP